MKKLSVILVSLGLAASLFGFGVSYWAVTRFEPRVYHYFFITLGLLATICGFYQAFRAIRLSRITVRGPLLALSVNSTGMVTTLYGFGQAFRGLHRLPQGWESTAGFLLVAIGMACALYGFLRAYKLIIPYLALWRTS